MRRLAAALLVALAALAAPVQLPAAVAQEVRTHQMQARTRLIDRFRIGSDQQRFGELEFAGGLEMNASSRHFGALSGLDFRDDGQSRFVAVADTGFWLTGAVERDAARRPVGLSDLRMSEMTGPDGRPFNDKWLADAEAVAIDGSTIWVGFEREHRIARYVARADAFAFQTAAQPPVPMHELRRNRGFEGIAVAPPASALSGALVGLSEYSLDAAGNIMAFAMPPDAPSFEFSVRKSGGYYLTDLDFLPDGDAIVLERRFNVRDGVAMRLRRIDDAAIAPGATVDGQVLLEADMRYQIDNMEGLSITIDPDGVPRLSIVSDDNHSLLQRNLLIEFRLVGPDVSARPAAPGG